MNTGPRLVLAALTCAAVALLAYRTPAEMATGTPSQEDISRQLKTRGLPILGTAPTPPPRPSLGVTPANVPSAPFPNEVKHRRMAPAAADRPVSTSASPRVTLRTITFEFGSAQLRPESVETLRNLGNALNQDLKDEKEFLIEGHTDQAGTRAYNDELSKRRADAVKDYLVKDMGVSADRLRTIGKGFSEPVDPKHPYAPENRRVVVVNISPS